MTPPINSVSDEEIARLAKKLRTKTERVHDLSGVGYIDDADCHRAANLLEALAARRAANTPVDGEEEAKLVAYFRGEGLVSFGIDGDYEGRSPAETAIHAMKELAALRRAMAEKVIDAAAASPALPSQVVAKELVWHGPDFEDEYYAPALGGNYTIGKANGNGRWLGGVGGYFATIETAKAAAQADFNARIQSCLTSPAAEPVAWMRRWAFDGIDVMAIKPPSARPKGWQFHEITRVKIAPDDVPLTHPAPSASREVTDEMVERAAQELLAHGVFSSIPWRNHDNALKAARAALLAALPEREVE